MADTASPAAKALEAVRKRLAAAKTQASYAAEAFESAKEAEDSTRKMAEMAIKNACAATKFAKSQYNDIKKQVEEAEACLKEAEEMCEVVAVKSEDDDQLFDADTDDESNENESRKKQKTGDVEAIVVEGCGSPEVNGTYKRSDELWGDGHEYYKEGQWRGKYGMYKISYDSYAKKWFICVGGRCWLYYAPETTGFTTLPPENGWKVQYGIRGVHPAPKLKFS